jgi:hypothetical protein
MWRSGPGLGPAAGNPGKPDAALANHDSIYPNLQWPQLAAHHPASANAAGLRKRMLSRSAERCKA